MRLTEFFLTHTARHSEFLSIQLAFLTLSIAPAAVHNMAPPEGDPIEDGDWDEVQVIPEDVADLPHFQMPLVKTPSLPPPTPAASPLVTTVVTEAMEDESSIIEDLQDMAHLMLLDAPLACDDDENQEFLLDPQHAPTKDEKRVIKVLKYMRFLICVAAIGGFTSGYSSGEFVPVLYLQYIYIKSSLVSSLGWLAHTHISHSFVPFQ